MPSNHVGSDVYKSTISMLTDADPPAAATWRGTLEDLHNNDAHLKAKVTALEVGTQLRNSLIMFKVRSGDPDNPGMAAYSLGKGAGTLLVKAGSSNMWKYADGGHYLSAGVDLPSITSQVEGCAYNPTAGRLVAIGVGGNNCAFTDNFGLNWTAGGAIGGACHAIVWNNTHSRFLVSRQSGNNVAFSSNATVWASIATSLTTDVIGGLAVLAGGNTVACGSEGTNAPAFSVSANGGTTWSDSGGTVLDSGTYDDTGWVASRTQPDGTHASEIFHVGRRSSGATLRVSRSVNGTNWTTVADLPATLVQSGMTYTGRPRLFVCPNTGLLVVICPFNSSVMAMFASVDGGVTWGSPVIAAGGQRYMYTLAAGRLFSGLTTETFASIGVAS